MEELQKELDELHLENKTLTMEELQKELDELRLENKTLKIELASLKQKNLDVDLASPLGILVELGRNQLRIQKEANVSWLNKPLESIQNLRPDYSGKVGELLLNRLCEIAGMTVSYTGDSNIKASDGTYDVKIKWDTEKKDEVKTAWRGSNGGFQHESLRAKGCDQTIFIDIVPNAYYITVLEKFDMTQQHPVIGRKPHLRKGTTDVYKFDFGEVNIQRAINSKLSIKVDASTPMTDVIEFLKRFH